MPANKYSGVIKNAAYRHLLPGCFIILCFCGVSQALDDPAQPQSNLESLAMNSEKLFSPFAGRVFSDLAYDIGQADPNSGTSAEQAFTLLMATNRLDTTAAHILPDIIRLLARHPDRNQSELMYSLLVNYAGKYDDLEVDGVALSYLVSGLNSREQREALLAKLLQTCGGRNKMLDSELATGLALLNAEKPDANAAQAYFLAAYNNNKYNKIAFDHLLGLLGDQVKPSTFLGHLRLLISENPLDLQAAMSFAQYAEKLQLYEIAADAYRYGADLFEYLHPSDALPSTIYLPWALSCYNAERREQSCIRIAAELRQTGQFDLLLEAIAGKAALKLGDRPQAESILKTAEDKAIELAATDTQLGDLKQKSMNQLRLAWFYCFALPDANKAVMWANKAYAAEPNSPIAAAMLAYSLVADRQTDWPRLLLDNYPRNQISDLAMAMIQLAEGQKASALETLKTAVARDPTSLAAERAKEIMTQQGTRYIPPDDPAVILTILSNEFGQTATPRFVPPDKIIEVGLKLRGSRFSYDTRFDGEVTVANNSSEVLVISDDGLFKGNIRIDARITGDLTMEIPGLVTLKTQPSSPVNPGSSISIPVRLFAGRLKRALLDHPQAALSIEFTVYIDPVMDNQGKVVATMTGMEPARVVVERERIELTTKYLQNRLDSLRQGQQGQKIKAAELFAGLLAEQQLMAASEKPPYKFASADWMPDLLKSALKRNLADADWVVKVHTMSALLLPSLDYELAGAVSQNLGDSRWPVRLMAVYLLAKSQGQAFGKVLDWTATNDQNQYVRRMAVALGGKAPETKPAPAPTPPAPK